MGRGRELGAARFHRLDHAQQGRKKMTAAGGNGSGSSGPAPKLFPRRRLELSSLVARKAADAKHK
jgi:hypothetical protein